MYDDCQTLFYHADTVEEENTSISQFVQLENFIKMSIFKLTF